MLQVYLHETHLYQIHLHRIHQIHLQLAKGTRPWRVRSYGVGLHPAVKAESNLPPVEFKTNPARPAFKQKPSSYKKRSPSSSYKKRSPTIPPSAFPSLDERVENFKDFKYERVGHLKNFLDDERLANNDDIAPKAHHHQKEKVQTKRQESQELSKKARDENVPKGRVRSVKIEKASKSIAAPREKSSFLSSKLSPVCSVMQSLKRKVGRVGVDDEVEEDDELSKKRRIEIIRDPRRRKREEEKLKEKMEKMQEEKKRQEVEEEKVRAGVNIILIITIVKNLL